MTAIKLYEAPETIIINNIVYYKRVKYSNDLITIGYYSNSSGACICSAIGNSYLQALRQLELNFIEIRQHGDYIYWD